MHAHSVLMLAAAGFVWLFGAMVVVVTLLARRGRIREPDRQVPLGLYGPVFAGALSGGAAAVHVGAVGSHAATAITTSAGPVAFLCSIAAGPTHITTVDASLAGLAPLGAASLGLIPLQVAWAHPRLWSRTRLAAVGLAVTLAALAIAGLRAIVAPALATTAPAPPDAGFGAGPLATTTLGANAAGSITSAGMADALGLLFQLGLVVVAAVLLWGRPRRLAKRFVVRVTEGWVLAGSLVGGVGLLVVATLLTDHAVQ